MTVSTRTAVAAVFILTTVRTWGVPPGLDPGNSGFPSRWTEADRGEPVKYLVDTEAMPAGITTNEALIAVSNAFQAWADVSSLSFEFEGIQYFGTDAISAANVEDYRIRIQTHDLYNGITGGVPGRGGRMQRWNLSYFPNGGFGGWVGTNGFDLATAGYVMLDHTASVLEDPITLEEVICHEIGHVLGLGHSSEDPGETNSALKEAMMYYQIHGDDRGAQLADWDITTVRFPQPTNNVPPFTYPRMIDAVTSEPQWTNIPLVNRVELRSYDLDGDTRWPALSHSTTNNGTWTIDGKDLLYTPEALFPDSDRIDPATNQAYDMTYVRITDGVNTSPPVQVKVLSFSTDMDGFPDCDGLPDTWADSHNVSGSTNDPDGDGHSNIQEWINGTDPTNGNSALKITGLNSTTLQWSAKGYEIYELWRSASLTSDFSRCRNPARPLPSPGTIDLPVENGTIRFYRIIKTP